MNGCVRKESRKKRGRDREVNTDEPHMRSQASVCTGASRQGEGSWTITSPLEVTDHKACLDRGPLIPLASQQHSTNRDTCRNTQRHPHRDHL